MRTADDLHDYQQRLIDRLYEHNRTIAVVPMGGGKTVSTLSAVTELLMDSAVRHVWVIAPKRVAQTVWPTEITEWAHLQGLSVSVVMGTPPQRERALKTRADIHVINFDNVQWLEKQIGAFTPDDGVVIDELSRCKNPQSKRAKALQRMMKNVVWRVGLTGTPKPKDHQDLFMQMLLIHGPKVWGSNFWKWRKDYFYPTDYQQYNWEPRPGYDVLIDETFARLSFSVDEDEMRQAIVVPRVIPEPVTIPPAAKLAHDTALRAWVLKHGDTKELLASAAVGSIKARQIASGTVYDENRQPHPVHDAKVEALMELIEDANEPTLVAYQFLPELDALRKLYGADLPVLGGGVKDADSIRYIDDWNAGKIPVMAIHPASAGHGLNLQKGGRRLIWFSLPWSLEEYQQTIARLARQGQEHAVFVHVLMAMGTIDEAVYARLQQRANAQSLLLDLIARLREPT